MYTLTHTDHYTYLITGVVPGPSTAGALVQTVGFPALMLFIGVVNILYAPLCFLLRNPAVSEEKLVSVLLC